MVKKKKTDESIVEVYLIQFYGDTTFDDKVKELERRINDKEDPVLYPAGCLAICSSIGLPACLHGEIKILTERKVIENTLRMPFFNRYY